MSNILLSNISRNIQYALQVIQLAGAQGTENEVRNGKGLSPLQSTSDVGLGESVVSGVLAKANLVHFKLRRTRPSSFQAESLLATQAILPKCTFPSVCHLSHLRTLLSI